jgi:hypothetical protein
MLTSCSIWNEVKMKLKIKAVILALNYAIAVIICLTLLVADQFSLAERAVYGFGAILIGMAIRNIVTTMIPGE